MVKRTDRVAAPAAGDLIVLLPSWELSLRAANTAPRTIETYSKSARQFLASHHQLRHTFAPSWLSGRGSEPG